MSRPPFYCLFALDGAALKKLHPDSPTSLYFIIVNDAHPCKKQVKYFLRLNVTWLGGSRSLTYRPGKNESFYKLQSLLLPLV